jgi:hypothetical protein
VADIQGLEGVGAIWDVGADGGHCYDDFRVPLFILVGFLVLFLLWLAKGFVLGVVGFL